MNLNETLRSMQQSIEGLARQFHSVARYVEELKSTAVNGSRPSRYSQTRTHTLRGCKRVQTLKVLSDLDPYPYSETWTQIRTHTLQRLVGPSPSTKEALFTTEEEKKREND
ncbi:hypothetical protein M9H77_30980 [Catharanthus roseus]|uniref:Uncharacterized protein n=1 Tax=Catharanthus roseus TaxID=4058 RepID=A0ACC0A143_CATRO|nr:hypothetical protein M9H77_30980 [Catharanthus roseus]